MGRLAGTLVDRVLGFSVQHPLQVVAVVLVATVAAAAWLPRIALRLDARSLLPTGEPELRRSDELSAAFDRRDSIVLAVGDPARGIHTPDALARIRRLSKALAATPGIVDGSVVSLATQPVLTIDDGVLDVAPLVPRVPSPERLRARVHALALDDGILVSGDGCYAAIYAGVEPATDRFDLDRRIRAMVDAETGGGIAVRAGGNALAQAELGRAAASDLARLMPAMLVVLFVLLVAAYRSVWVPIVTLVEIGVALLWTGGVMGATHQGLFVTTLIFPVLLLAIGVSDDVYAVDAWLARWDGVSDPKVAIATAFRGAARPIAFSTATTVAGLLSMTITRLEPLRTFGWFGALAIAVSSLLTFTLVPALLVLVGPRMRASLGRHKRSSLGQRVARGLAAPGARRPGTVVAALLVLGLAAMLVAMRARVNDSWVGNLPPDGMLARDTAELDRHLAGMTVVDLAFERRGGRIDDPVTFGALVRLSAVIAALPGVGAVSSIDDHLMRALGELDGLPLAALRTRLLHGESVAGPELEQVMLLIRTSAPELFRQLVDPTQTRAWIRVFVREADARRIGALVAAAAAAAPADVTLTPFGDGWISYVAVQLLVTGQLASIATAGLVTLLLMAVVFRSWRMAIAATVPVLLSIVAVLAVLAGLGISLGIASSMFAAIGLGIGSDYALHLGDRFHLHPWSAAAVGRAQCATGDVGASILTSAAAVCGAMSVLMLSASPPNRMLGLLIMLCLACCAVITLVAFPAMVQVTRRRR